jgi:O-antigen/teichoic acid export membrane protein
MSVGQSLLFGGTCPAPAVGSPSIMEAIPSVQRWYGPPGCGGASADKLAASFSILRAVLRGSMSVAAESIRNRLVRGTGWVTAGKVGTFPLGLAVLFLLARLLNPRQMGVYFLALSLVTTGATIAKLGMEKTVVRLVSASRAVGLPGRARSAVRAIFTIGAVSALAVGGFMALGGGRWLAGHLFNLSSRDLTTAMIVFTAAWLVAFTFQDLFSETFRGLQDFKLATLFEALLVDAAMAAIFGAMYALRGRGSASLTQVLMISAAVFGGSVLLAAVLMRPRLRLMRGEGETSPGEVLGISLPLLVTNLSVFVLGAGVDLWVLGAFRTKPEVALYGAAVRMVFFLVQPFIILQSVTPPIIAELHAQGRREELERAVRATATIAGIPSFLLLLVFVFFGRSVMGALFGDPFYRQAATVLAILSISRLYFVWTGSSGVALMMTGHQKALMYITIFCGVISVTGGVLLAPHFGGPGVASATAFGQILQNTLQLFYAKKYVGIWTHVQLSMRPLLQFIRG